MRPFSVLSPSECQTEAHCVLHPQNAGVLEDLFVIVQELWQVEVGEVVLGEVEEEEEQALL